MFYVSKRMEIAYGHKLNLPYESKCTNLHGHNGIVTVYCKSEKLDPSTSMVIDFKVIKELIHDKLDHQLINDVIPEINPTAEAMAKWICDTINGTLFEDNRWFGCFCYKVSFQESEGNIATYECTEEDW